MDECSVYSVLGRVSNLPFPSGTFPNETTPVNLLPTSGARLQNQRHCLIPSHTKPSILKKCGNGLLPFQKSKFRMRGVQFLRTHFFNILQDRIWGPSWGNIGAILGPSWGHLGAILGPSWGHLGAGETHLSHFDFTKNTLLLFMAAPCGPENMSTSGRLFPH